MTSFPLWAASVQPFFVVPLSTRARKGEGAKGVWGAKPTTDWAQKRPTKGRP